MRITSTKAWRTAALLTVLSVGAVGGAVVPSTVQAATSAIVSDSACTQHRLSPNDDGSTARVSLPFNLNFFGKQYGGLYVNNNGNVTFGGPQSTYTPFTINASTPPIIAPFFADIDTRPSISGVTTYGVTTFEGHTAFCVNWRRVGYYANHTDKTDSFQLLLVKQGTSGDFKIVMNYGSLQFETGDASGGSGGLGGTSAGAGFSNGDGNQTHYYAFPGSLRPGGLLDTNQASGLIHGSRDSTGVEGRYEFSITSGTRATTDCKKSYFISLRGSGETSTGPSDTGQNDAKRTYEVYRGYQAAFALRGFNRSDLGFEQVDYQAASTDLLLKSYKYLPGQSVVTTIPTYLGSVYDGKNALESTLFTLQQRCRRAGMTAHFILAGYSQGALAIREVLYDRADAPLVAQVDGVGLVADPARNDRANGLRNYGTSNPGYGICHQFNNFGHADVCMVGTDEILPLRFRSITYETCDRQDIVCDTSNSRVLASEGARIHGNYQNELNPSTMGAALARLLPPL